jgi:hypothetical protein
MLFDFYAMKAQAKQSFVTPALQVDNNRMMSRTKRTNFSLRHNNPKIITGSPKSLCLRHLGELEYIASAQVVIVRQESPWDTCQQAITCDITGAFIVAARCSGRPVWWPSVSAR